MNWWTPARIEQLTAILARKPKPFAIEIVIEMGAISRGAIIGKARRLGLKLRPQHRTQKPPQPNRRAKFRPPAKPVADIPDFLGKQRRERARATALANIAARQAADEATKSGGVGFFDHKEGQCRWPLTEARSISEFRFCGAKAADGTYCIEHARRSIKRYFVAEAPE